MQTAKRIFYLLAIFLVYAKVIAQPYFQKTVDPGILLNFNETIHTKSADSGFLLLCKTYSFANANSDFLIKTNPEGTIKWIRKYEAFTGTGFAMLVPTPDNGCILVGTVSSTTNVPRTWLAMCKIDEQGNVVWGKTFRGANFERPAAYLSNNTVYVCGRYVDDITQEASIYLLRTNLSGDLQSFSSRRAEYVETVSGITVTPSGLTALCGIGHFTDGQGNPLIIHADASGNLLNYNDIALSGKNECRAITHNGEQIYAAGNSSNGPNNVPFMLNLAFAGAGSGGRTTFNYPYSVSFNAIDVGKDGNPVIGGQLYTGATGFTGMMLKLKPDFSVDWARNYGDSTVAYKRFSSIYTDKDGNFSATGILVFNHYYGAQLIQANPDGYTGCFEYPETFQKTTDNFNSSQYLPAKGSLNTPFEVAELFAFDTITVFDTKQVCEKDTCRAGFIIAHDSLCAGAALSVTDTTKSATTYKWEFEKGTPATFKGAHPPGIVYSTPGYYKIRLIAANSISSDTADTYIRVLALPVAHAGPDRSICKGDTIRLQGSGGVYYKWSPPISYVYPDSANPLVHPIKNTIYYLEVTDSFGCIDDDSVTISVTQRPVVAKMDTAVCDDETILLDAGNIGFKYKWTTGAGTKTIVAAPGNYQAIISNSCFTDTSFFAIEGKDCRLAIYIPNAFTPGDDNGLNDSFAISGENIAQVTLSVFNRWGELMFEGSGARTAWDGTFNDIPCPANPYIYIVQVKGLKGGKRTISGIVNLIR